MPVLFESEAGMGSQGGPWEPVKPRPWLPPIFRSGRSQSCRSGPCPRFSFKSRAWPAPTQFGFSSFIPSSHLCPSGTEDRKWEPVNRGDPSPVRVPALRPDPAVSIPPGGFASNRSIVGTANPVKLNRRGGSAIRMQMAGRHPLARLALALHLPVTGCPRIRRG